MALQDVTVIDLTHVVAGPFATKILKDHGARVIKVENPKTGGDVTRQLLPKVKEDGWSAYFETLNGGKESIALSLSLKDKAAADDRKMFEAMLEKADVLVENFRPGVLAELGYSWESLHERFPKLIVASISGFGQNGPYMKRKAVDTIVQGMSGFMACTGTPDSPVKVGTTVSDLLAGVYCATGIVTALHARHRTGTGSRVDISMFDTSFSFHAREFALYQLEGIEPERIGNLSGVGIYPFDVFECLNGQAISVSCPKDPAYAAFCRLIDAPELIQDPLFKDPASRWKNQKALQPLLKAKVAKVDRATLLEGLKNLKGNEAFPFGPVNNFQDLQTDPQLIHRGMIEPRRKGSLRVVGNPVKVTSPALDRSATYSPIDAPTLGQHTESLKQEFGMAPRSRL
mmetsp:Transcript_67384/g.146684  ORF Transcript_67384/g.146684 Transcript_67384/m.146684 type:complete len:400 (+) Transcript_67384:48-1247(+)